jgi:hypothetical protein
MYMEISHGNSLVSNKNVMFFFLSFHLCKIKNRRVKQVLPRGEVAGKGVGG